MHGETDRRFQLMECRANPEKYEKTVSVPVSGKEVCSSPETAASTGRNRDMTPTSIIQPGRDRAVGSQLKIGSKRARDAVEDVAFASAAAGEPLFQIVTRRDFSAATYLLEVRHPLLALAARPGQFVIVQSHERGERIPLTIADFDRQKGTVTLVIQAVGKTTGSVATLQEWSDKLGRYGPRTLSCRSVQVAPV
jgi:hypothetical protein